MTTPQRISSESELLIELLIQAADAGRDKVPYEELSLTAGLDVTDQKGRGFLATARNRVQEDRGEVWGCERGTGVFLVPHGERAKIYQSATTSVRRKVHRTKKVMKTVDLQSLTAEEMESFNTGQVILTLMGRSASKSVIRRVEKAAKEGDARVVTFQSQEACLDFLRKAKGKKKKKTEVRPETDPRPPAQED